MYDDNNDNDYLFVQFELILDTYKVTYVLKVHIINPLRVNFLKFSSIKPNKMLYFFLQCAHVSLTICYTYLL